MELKISDIKVGDIIKYVRNDGTTYHVEVLNKIDSNKYRGKIVYNSLSKDSINDQADWALKYPHYDVSFLEKKFNTEDLLSKLDDLEDKLKYGNTKSYTEKLQKKLNKKS